MPEAEELLAVRHAVKTYGGVRALDDVSLSLRAGEIRCLAGENGSGKSTLIKLVAGVVAPDAGEIVIAGRAHRRLHAIDAIRGGVQVIYQDLSLFPKLSVAENISMNSMISQRRWLVNRRAMRALARAQLARVGVRIPLDAAVQDLSMANRQVVAICRALSLQARILIMDEPTTALTRQEVDRLLSIVLELKRGGLSVVFVSHKLGEVFRVADRITILRDGRCVGDFAREELDVDSLAFHMTGQHLGRSAYRNPFPAAEPPLLELRGLTRLPHYQEVSFRLHRGEVVGLTGLLGSGRTELALSLFGLNPPQAGEVRLGGELRRMRSPRDALASGVALLPEDRNQQGLFLEQSIAENVTSTLLDRLRRALGFLDDRAGDAEAERALERLRIKAPSIRAQARSLSGGNQQKTVLAKWVATEPQVFILDGPTVGIDVGSKAEIYRNIHAYAGRGMGVLLISDELPELLNNCTRILVMRGGRVVGDLEAARATEEAIFALMSAAAPAGDAAAGARAGAGAGA